MNTCRCIVALNVRYSPCTRSLFTSLPVVRSSVTLRRLLDSQAHACFQVQRRGFICDVIPSAPARSLLLQTQPSSAALGVELRTEFAPRTRPLAPLHFSVSAQVLALGASPLKQTPPSTSFLPRISRISQSCVASFGSSGYIVHGIDLRKQWPSWLAI